MPSIEFSSSYSVSYWGAISAHVRLTFSESYNMNTNQTTLTLTGLEFKKDDSSNLGDVSIFGSISVNGTTVCTIDNTGSGKNASVILNGTGWCSASLSGLTRTPVTVTHNADGTKSVTVTVTAGANSRFCALYTSFLPGKPVPFGVPTSSGTMALTTRPRLTQVSATDANFGSPVTITLNRYNSAFTHTITATCAGHSETLMTKGSTYPTLTWTPTVATYAPLVTGSMSATATITCQTYNGDQLLGSSSTTCVLTFLAADVAPSVTIAVSDPTGNLTTYGKFVKSKSKITVTLTPTFSYGASLRLTSISANGATFNSSPATTDFIVSASNTTVSGTITDSRGQTATVSTTIQIYDYDSPKINSFSAHRCNQDGTDNNAGAYFKVVYDIEISPLGNQNSKTLKIKYKKISASSYTETTETPSSYSGAGTTSPIAADTNSTYNVQVELIDDFGSATTELVLPTASTRMNWGAGENGGMAIGKVSEYDKTLEVADDWTIKGKGFINLIYPVGSLYMSVNSTDPGTLFGGSWERIQDTFLLAAGTTYTAGATGGAATHAHTTGDCTLNVNQIPSHTHPIHIYQSSAKGNNFVWGGNSTTSGHTTLAGGSNAINATGGGQAHNHGNTGAADSMPPYLVVYVWKRTA